MRAPELRRQHVEWHGYGCMCPLVLLGGYVPEPFLICFECKHAYMTERELFDTYNQIGRQADEDAKAKGWTPLEFQPVDDAGQIWFCPLCMHDF
jgi:hypothetical protein